MTEQPQDLRPVFDQINLVVADIDASARFYRDLGVDVAEAGGGWPPATTARHIAVEMPSGVHFELDNIEMARLWHAGVRDTEAGGRVVVGFSYSTPEAVDEAYLAATSAGYPGRQPPYDAFWGARYAVVADPDGNDVGLMGPVDPARGYVPEVKSLTGDPKRPRRVLQAPAGRTVTDAIGAGGLCGDTMVDDVVARSPGAPPA